MIEDLENEDRADPVEDPEIHTLEPIDESPAESAGDQEKIKNEQKPKKPTKKPADKKEEEPGRGTEKRKSTASGQGKKGKPAALSGDTGGGGEEENGDGIWPWDC